MLLASLAGTLGNLGLFFGLLVSLLRYRLYDAEAIVSRPAALDRVTTGLRAVHGAIVIDGVAAEARGIDPDAVHAWLAGWTPPRDRERLDCDRADPLMPVRLPLHAEDMQRVGWLLLGPRPDGSFYGKDERETLAGLADPIARALAVAHRREARESERQRDFGDLRRLVTLLHERLARLEERALPRGAGVP